MDHSNWNPPVEGIQRVSNDGAALWDRAVANTLSDDKGKALITYNLKQFGGRDFTVANVQNTWVHEFGKHFLDKIKGGSNAIHALAIKAQSLHPTWKDTTENYKNNMRTVYHDYTGKNLGR